MNNRHGIKLSELISKLKELESEFNNNSDGESVDVNVYIGKEQKRGIVHVGGIDFTIWNSKRTDRPTMKGIAIIVNK